MNFEYKFLRYFKKYGWLLIPIGLLISFYYGNLASAGIISSGAGSGVTNLITNQQYDDYIQISAWGFWIFIAGLVGIFYKIK